MKSEEEVNTAKIVLSLVEKEGVVRARDLAAQGISPTHLQRLYEQGKLVRSGRGIYALPDKDLGNHFSLAEIARRVPAGVVCLFSALDFHGLTTQLPHQVWIAIPPRTHRPQVDWPPVKSVQMTGASLKEGMEVHTILNTPVRIFSPAKTVADCFKFRNKIGQDVALEALHDAWRKKKVTMDELTHYAEVCRVAQVMRPYLETLV
jgi:predicted transcriptional regulator of viral defense system